MRKMPVELDEGVCGTVPGGKKCTKFVGSMDWQKKNYQYHLMQGWLEYSVFNSSNVRQDAVDTFLKCVFCYNIFCPKLTSVGDMGSKLKLLIGDIRILKTTTIDCRINKWFWWDEYLPRAIEDLLQALTKKQICTIGSSFVSRDLHSVTSSSH